MRLQVEFMENTLKSETMDETWSVSAAASIYGSVEENNTDEFEVSNVDCRTTFCRAELFFELDSMEERIKSLRNFTPWNGKLFYYYDDIVSGNGVVYLAREDYRLPNPAAVENEL